MMRFNLAVALAGVCAHARMGTMYKSVTQTEE